ncbi:DUF4870 domain-containing protein [Candidatus Micrarchaeota archaeon]|nr:DUF4870 domain-containing protein [Candidatus Micrarchaeota archaeon]
MAGEKMAAPKASEPKAAPRPETAEPQPAPEPKPASTTSDNALIGALCYLIGVIVPLFVLLTEKKENKTLSFHAWQSLIVDAVAVVVLGGFFFLTIVVSAVTMGVGSLLGCLSLPLVLVYIAVKVVLAYKAYQGEEYMLPTLGELSRKQAKK